MNGVAILTAAEMIRTRRVFEFAVIKRGRAFKIERRKIRSEERAAPSEGDARQPQIPISSTKEYVPIGNPDEP